MFKSNIYMKKLFAIISVLTVVLLIANFCNSRGGCRDIFHPLKTEVDKQGLESNGVAAQILPIQKPAFVIPEELIAELAHIEQPGITFDISGSEGYLFLYSVFGGERRVFPQVFSI